MITIELLKNHREAIPRLAKIWYEVLGAIWVPDIPMERVTLRFQEHLNEHCLPLTYVAFKGKIPIGMCSLRENDSIRPDLLPWLGSLVVDPDYQKQGVAKLLINAIKEKAIQLGFKKLYLFSFDPTITDYYERLGWQKIDKDEFKGHPVTVMECSL